MHDPNAQGTEFFKCDYCHASWEESNPMVEGHRGSLLCAKCIRVAYTQLVSNEAPDLESTESCAMCLEARNQPIWVSPATDAHACLRCVKLGARALESDDDTDWQRPDTSDQNS
ncbi:MAG: hypothetical protein ACYTF7_12360 [Planctomycetota bacterium]|jgi:hypothetical protein